MLPNLATNKFPERPSGDSRMQENLLAEGAPPQTPLRTLTSLSLLVANFI